MQLLDIHFIIIIIIIIIKKKNHVIYFQLMAILKSKRQ